MKRERLAAWLALCGLVVAVALAVVGVLVDARDAPLLVRIFGFGAFTLWVGAAVVAAYGAVGVAFDHDTGWNLWARTLMVAASALTVATAGAALFRPGTQDRLAEVVVTLSTSGQATVARQCGEAVAPVLQGTIDEETVDDAKLVVELPPGTCGAEGDEVEIPRDEIVSTRFVDDEAPAVAQVAIDWSVPDRLREGGPEAHAEVSPRSWPVELVVGDPAREACVGAEYAWTVAVDGGDGVIRSLGPADAPIRRVARCVFAGLFPAEGSYRVEVAVREAGRLVAVGSTAVVVEDWLIVSLGDSVASGEGNPAKRAPLWLGETQHCHRSREAGPLLAALAIEGRDPKSSVTFVHLACTGARTRRQSGDTFKPGQTLLADDAGATIPISQVGQLRDLLRGSGREIDALLVSIGANDIVFSQIVKYCLMHRRCDEAYRERLPARFQLLRANYETLEASLASADGLGVQPERVYLTEYFDPTRDENGAFCSIGLRAIGRIDPSESRWAYEDVFAPLNAAGRAAAARAGWTYVDGPAGSFRTHGYCAKDRWVLSIRDAILASSPGLLGRLNPKRLLGRISQFPFHPNARGHEEYAERISLVLARRFGL